MLLIPRPGDITICNIISFVPEIGIFAGFNVNDFYLTDKNSKHEVLVCIGHKAFADDEFESIEEITAELEDVLWGCLPDGFKRFEAIMENGIKVN